MTTTKPTSRRTVRSILAAATLSLALGCSITAATAATTEADAVICVQKQLNALGFSAGFADGVVGVRTFLASEAYTRYMSANGQGGVARLPLNNRTARDWCKSLADDHPKVASFWDDLAESEVPADPEAIFDVAYGFDTATAGGDRKDDAQAARWYLKAAQLGYAPAQRNLARLYAAGRGVYFNTNTARYWFTVAANQGDAESQYVLGKIYSANEETSLAWLWKAARQGHSAAITELQHRLHI